MEDWQKETIRANLPELIDNIHCNADLIARLRQYGALGKVDEEKIAAIGNQAGNSSQSKLLLEILQSRVQGYEHLTKSLKLCNQSGAHKTLRDALKTNILSIPVYFGGSRLSMRSILKILKPDQQENARIMLSEYMDAFHDELKAEWEIILTRNTIPVPISYYVSRCLGLSNKLKVEFFHELSPDIFIIEMIERSELTKLAESVIKQDFLESLFPSLYLLSDDSSSQIKKPEPTVRFIRLENPNHFQNLSQKGNLKPVHWIRYQSGSYFYITSNSARNLSDVKAYLEDTQHHIFENEFILTSRSRTTVSPPPVLISDTPGIGKSVLLSSIAWNMKDRNPESNVIFLELKTLASEFENSGKPIDAGSLYEFLINKITTNKFGKNILREIIRHPCHRIELFLDGYDEIFLEHTTTALKLLQCIKNDCKNIRMYITSRPHKAEELENILCVVSHSIIRLDESDQRLLFERVCSSERKIEFTADVKRTVEACISEIQLVIAKKNGDSVAGIPLQCRLLANLFLDRIESEYFFSVETMTSISTLYDMYKEFVHAKFSNVSDKVQRFALFNSHVEFAISTLFNESTKLEYSELCTPIEMCRIGIVEMGFSRQLKFIHGTYAEFFVAEFALQILRGVNSPIMTQVEFIPFLFSQILKDCEHNFYVGCNEKQNVKVISRKFQNSGLTYFLNEGISKIFSTTDFSGIKALLHSSPYFSQAKFLTLLWCAIASDLSHLCQLLCRLYSMNDKLSRDVTVSEHPINCINQDFDGSSLGKIPGTNFKFWQNLILTAVRYSSVELVEFISSLALSMGYSNIHLTYETKITPLHVALQRGNYNIFELYYRHYKDNLICQYYLHHCLYGSAEQEKGVIEDKMRILDLLIKTRPELLNEIDDDGLTPILTKHAHFDLIRLLVNNDAQVFKEDSQKRNIAHHIANYFSPEDYHQFVKLMIENSHGDIFKSRDKRGNTPIHSALTKLELTLNTLELLHSSCNVKFSLKNDLGDNELFAAVQGKRSNEILRWILNVNRDLLHSRNRLRHSVLCISLMDNNLVALNLFLSFPMSAHYQCQYNTKNVLFHAIECREEVRFQAVQILVNKDANINSLIFNGYFVSKRNRDSDWLVPFRTPLTLAKHYGADSEIIKLLEKEGGTKYTPAMLLLNLFCFLFVNSPILAGFILDLPTFLLLHCCKTPLSKKYRRALAASLIVINCVTIPLLVKYLDYTWEVSVLTLSCQILIILVLLISILETNSTVKHVISLGTGYTILIFVLFFIFVLNLKILVHRGLWYSWVVYTTSSLFGYTVGMVYRRSKKVLFV